MILYALTAALLGAGWFMVLLAPRLTREWLLGDVPGNLACLVGASVMVALAGRRFIRRADGTLGAWLARATILPGAGTFVFLTLTALRLAGRRFAGGEGIGTHDAISLYMLGFTSMVLAAWVVFPYGLICQFVLQSLPGSAGASRRRR